jgi:hypothetical protein
MQRLEVRCAVRRIYTSLGAKGWNNTWRVAPISEFMLSAILPLLPQEIRNSMRRWIPKAFNFKPRFLKSYHIATNIKLEHIRDPSRVLCCNCLPDDTASYTQLHLRHSQDLSFQKLFWIGSEARHLDDWQTVLQELKTNEFALWSWQLLRRSIKSLLFVKVDSRHMVNKRHLESV